MKYNFNSSHDLNNNEFNIFDFYLQENFPFIDYKEEYYHFFTQWNKYYINCKKKNIWREDKDEKFKVRMWKHMFIRKRGQNPFHYNFIVLIVLSSVFSTCIVSFCDRARWWEQNQSSNFCQILIFFLYDFRRFHVSKFLLTLFFFYFIFSF